jgi:type II secretory pathway component GspD/PulD (secretin)
MKTATKNKQARRACSSRNVKVSHTPGPWKYNGYTDVYHSRGGTICEMPKGYEHSPEHRANAILIAAAPDMLKALENIISKFDEGKNVEGHCICDARAAIELAHGHETK